MNSTIPALPSGVVVLERGWLSSNNVVLVGEDSAAVVDSGYWSHSAQTLELIATACDGKPLTVLANTHLHSDHCGGNAALQERVPHLRTLIPPGAAAAVRDWDPVALTYVPTGQQCPRFSFDGLLEPGSSIRLGSADWEVHSAPGHDPHSVILFEPRTRTLISADALWENGFGVVFPELEGGHGFEEVSATLDVIERLSPQRVIPGHGPVFHDTAAALGRARSRLASFIADPRRHATHAAKVLLKFKMLEWQVAARTDLLEWAERDLLEWAERTSYLWAVHARSGGAGSVREWLYRLVNDLAKSGALRSDGAFLVNS